MNILQHSLMIIALLLSPIAWASPTPEPKEAAAVQVKAAKKVVTHKKWEISVKGGLTFMMVSQSTTIPHLFKPAVRIEGSYQLSKATAVGVEAHGITSSNENYRLISGNAVFRGYLSQGSLYRLWLRWGFGLGTGPAILNKDLSTSQALVPHVNMGISMDWSLGDRVLIGLEILSDDLITASLCTSIGFRL